MGTRCNVVIEYAETRVILYRHWDGYMSETGADLSLKLEAAKGDPTRFLGALLAGADESGRHDYELTHTIHGDIEYLYRFMFSTRDRSCLIRYGHIPISTQAEETTIKLNVMMPTTRGHFPSDFRKLVNHAIDQENKRNEIQKRARPNEFPWNQWVPRPFLNEAQGAAV